MIKFFLLILLLKLSIFAEIKFDGVRHVKDYSALERLDHKKRQELREWVNSHCNESHQTWEELTSDCKLDCHVFTRADYNYNLNNLPGFNNLNETLYIGGPGEYITFSILVLIIAIVFFLIQKSLFVKNIEKRYIYLFAVVHFSLSTYLFSVFTSVILFYYILFFYLMYILYKWLEKKQNDAKDYGTKRVWYKTSKIPIGFVLFVSVATYDVNSKQLLYALFDSEKFSKPKIDLGISIEPLIFNKNTLLNFGVHSGSLDVVKYMIEEKGFDPNVIGKSNSPFYGSALDYSLSRKCTKISDYLITLTPELNTNYSGKTQLRTAAISHNMKLLEKVMQETIFDEDDFIYALEKAIEYQDDNALNYILEHSSFKKRDPRRLFDTAYRFENSSAFKTLEDKLSLAGYCSKQCYELQSMLIRRNDFTMLKNLENKAGLKINCDLMALAAYDDNVKMFDYLFKKGVPPYCTSSYNLTIQEQIQRGKAYKVQDYLEKNIFKYPYKLED